MKKLLLLLAVVLMLSACVRKEEPKKDDFLNPTSEVKEEVKLTRIHVIDNGSAWDNFQILEVDGHQYLSNSAHGGFVHLESCPCKSK